MTTEVANKKGDKIMKTKKEMFEALTPIQYAGMFNEEVVAKRLKRWTKAGLEKMTELWHKHYTTSAHNLICACIMTFSEKNTDFEALEKRLCWENLI